MEVLTPVEFLRNQGCIVITGSDSDIYDSWNDVVALTDETAFGDNPHAWASATHELGHRDQFRQWPTMALWRHFWPIRTLLELDAWKRAERTLKTLYIDKTQSN